MSILSWFGVRLYLELQYYLHSKSLNKLFFLFLNCEGLEFVDGEYFMSCVVTNKWSDWSTQTWKDNKLALRVHKIRDDYVVRTQKSMKEIFTYDHNIKFEEGSWFDTDCINKGYERIFL